MKFSRNSSIGVLIGIFLFICAGPVYAQQTPEDQTEKPEGELKTPGDVKDAVLEKFKDLPDSLDRLIEFADSGALTERLEGKIPPAKLKKIEETLRDGKFTEKQLYGVLKELDLTDEEFETALDFFSSHFELLRKVGAAAPIALAMDKLEKEVGIKRKERESAGTEEEKIEISQELDSMGERLETLVCDFEKHTAGVGKNDMSQLPLILKKLGRIDEESQIISRHIHEQVEFVKNVDTVRSIIQSINALAKDIALKEDALALAATEDERETISGEIKRLANRLKTLERNLTVITTGIDTDALEKKEEKEFDWDKELKLIFFPIIKELRDVTSQPRTIERLRGEITHYEMRIPQINQGVAHIAKFKKNVRDADIRERLDEAEKYWKQRGKEVETRLETSRRQLFDLEKQKGSMLERIKFIFESFVKQRGKNALFAIIAFIFTFVLFYLFRKFVMMINPLRYIRRYRYLAYLVDTSLYVMTFVAAILAVVFVLYVRGDWLMLGLIIVLFIGFGWAMKNMLPQFTEQIKLIMNVGPVRLAEMVVHNGISWRVESIGIYCHLKNPLLTGGYLRLPIKDLIGMRSRPCDEKETWFPCKEGDYILINNKDRRKVMVQTPESMVFTWYGMRENMPTAAFLNQKVLNLSAAPYWTGIMFYIAAGHRLDALKIGKSLEARVDEDMRKSAYAEQYLEAWAEFRELTEDSALGFMVWARMNIDAGAVYDHVKMALTQIALATANEQGWEIVRFTHIQQHIEAGKKGHEVKAHS